MARLTSMEALALIANEVLTLLLFKVDQIIICLQIRLRKMEREYLKQATIHSHHSMLIIKLLSMGHSN